MCHRSADECSRLPQASLPENVWFQLHGAADKTSSFQMPCTITFWDDKVIIIAASRAGDSSRGGGPRKSTQGEEQQQQEEEEKQEQQQQEQQEQGEQEEGEQTQHYSIVRVATLSDLAAEAPEPSPVALVTRENHNSNEFLEHLEKVKSSDQSIDQSINSPWLSSFPLLAAGPGARPARLCENLQRAARDARGDGPKAADAARPRLYETLCRALPLQAEAQLDAIR